MAMTRAELRAERKAQLARTAIAVFARMAAKDEVKRNIRAQGLRLHDFSARDLALRAEAWLEAHPELIAEARAKAASLGYVA
jgi:hypothetical protein